MTINFKQPKYILPLIALPFLCLFFYVYSSGKSQPKKEVRLTGGMNGAVGDVSPDVRKKKLDDKLDAYRNAYKESDGNTAVIPIPTDNTASPSTDGSNITGQKRMLDSINQLMKRKYGSPGGNRSGEIYKEPGVSAQDKALAEALNNLSNNRKAQQANSQAQSPAIAAKDPMQVFRQQIAYLDSIKKAADPVYQAQQKQLAQAKAEALRSKEPNLNVVKANSALADFNTITPEKTGGFIKVVIDENLTGYAGSRIRLRLLDDIVVGHYLIKKDSYLFALINGFTGQRVTLQVKSILYEDKILPVKLDVYDLDGLPGLYVPESAFRDFTKDLGQNTVQGVTIDNSGTGSEAQQFMMSTVSKVFESTSSAVAGIIRKNKAKIKYNSYLYLIDTDNSKEH